MTQNPPRESPLDLQQSARDELISGVAAVPLVPQVAEPTEQLAHSELPHCQRCDSAHRELASQLEVLRREELPPGKPR